MTVLEWSIPGGMILVVLAGLFELGRHKRRKRRGTPITATYLNEVTAMFYGTKRMELDHRDAVEMLREEDAQGAPPHSRVDLDKGVAVLRARPLTE